MIEISKALIVAGLLEMVGSLLTGFAPTLWVLILGRLLAAQTSQDLRHLGNLLGVV